MTMLSVYLVSSADKDYFCLTPLESELKKNFCKVKHIRVGDLIESLEVAEEICSAIWPIFIFNTRISIDFIRPLMGKRPFISVGLEHGVAPYKKYTYGKSLTDCNIYFAPTKLWADRLIDKYNPPLGGVRVGGYPRLGQLRENIAEFKERRRSAISSYWKSSSKKQRKLVALSWDVNPYELSKLPDRSDVVYLLHPSDAHIVPLVTLSEASVVVSNPDALTELLSEATVAIGDFSSMTMEIAALGIITYFIIDRSLYISDCDMDEGFFDSRHPNFSRIPYSDFQLPRECVCSRAQIEDLLNSDDMPDNYSASPLSTKSDFIPPKDREDASYIVSSLKAYTEQFAKEGIISHTERPSNIECLKFVINSYKKILFRSPDIPGALHYLNLMSSRASLSLMSRSLDVINAIANSDEAKKCWKNRSGNPFL